MNDLDNQDKIAGIDQVRWSNPDDFISKHYTVLDALYLRQWDRLVSPEELTPEILSNVLDVAALLDYFTDKFGWDINVTSFVRPPAYNVAIGGARQSKHMTGKAVDFIVVGHTAEEIREQLKPLMPLLRFSLEDDVSWIHLDLDPRNGEYICFKA